MKKQGGKISILFVVIIIVSVILILGAFLFVMISKNGTNSLGTSTDVQGKIEQAEKEANTIYLKKVSEKNSNKLSGNIGIADIIPSLQEKGYIIEVDSQYTFSSDNIKVKSSGRDVTSRLFLTPNDKKNIDVIVDMGTNAVYYIIFNNKSYEIIKKNGSIEISKQATNRKSSKLNQIPIVETATSTNSSVVDASVSNSKVNFKSGSTSGGATITITMNNNIAKSIPVRVQFDGFEKDGKNYNWDDIEKFSKYVVADENIGSGSTTAGPYKIDGKDLTLSVGDKGYVIDETGKSYNVRILGFKSDDLADGSGKAGISFEFVTSLGNYFMNSINSTEGGWKETDLRAVLNGGTKHDGVTKVSDDDAKVNKLSNAKNIKLVKKKYIPVYNEKNTLICNDKLWLLSSGEIWNNGYTDGARGVAITDESTENKQYMYYKMNLQDLPYNKTTDITKKPNTQVPVWWWLRSPLYGNMYTFCYVLNDGNGSNSGYSSIKLAVFPGFCI